MSSRFDLLVDKSVRLANGFPIMPVEELRLSVAFAELPHQEEVVARLIRELFDHDNMHLRRIAINACRRSEMFSVPGLKEALTEKLFDPAAWVRYDAAWAIHDAQYDSPEIRRRLKVNAANSKLPDDEIRVRKNPSDAVLQAQVRARETLDALEVSKRSES